MNLSLKEYIENVRLPKLSYHVKYSDFFEIQYDKLNNKLIAVLNAAKPIYFYSFKQEYDEFNKLLIEKKLIYNDKIIGENENWEYLIEYSLYFEKGFNSIDYNTPSSVIINNIPFCPTQKCIKPENNTSIIFTGRKSTTTKPCIAGNRPISIESFSGEGLLSSIKINYITNERVLRNPNEIAYKDGVMFKSIFQVIERYTELNKYFEINDEQIQSFIDILLNGIKELQTQDLKAECIREIKENEKNNEFLFRDWFKTYLAGRYVSVNSEPEKGNGKIDLKIQDDVIGTKIIEFKGWWNNDKKNITQQIMGYLTDFEEDGYIIMINHNKKKKISEEYFSLIKSNDMKYVENSYEQKKYNIGYEYHLTKHFDGIRTKLLYHIILNIY